MTDVDVSIIVVSFNTRELLAACLRSIYRERGDLSFEVIVVDNASRDHSAEMIREQFPRAQLIANDQNLGFAAANNQGFERATGRFILLLNPDAEVLDDAIGRTLAFAELCPQAGIVGARTLLPDGSQQSTVFRTLTLQQLLINLFIPNRWVRRSALLGRSRYVGIDLDRVQQVETVAGCFMLIRREVLEAVGDLDDDFFMYGEEAEWCFRVRRAGWRVLYYPGATIMHVGGQSAKQVNERMLCQSAKSQLLLLQKTQGQGVAWLGNVLMLLRDLPRGLLYAVLVVLGMRESRAGQALRPAVLRLPMHMRGLGSLDWRRVP